MKKILSLMLLVWFVAGCASLTPEEKAQVAVEDQFRYNLAMESLQNQNFVLEADKITFRRGRVAFVSATTNFIMMEGNRATVQVAFNTAYAGPNGIGGITLEGNVSNIEKKTNRKGDVTYNFNVMGTGISAQVSISMPANTNYASVSINPNFSSNRITLSGYIVPLEESNVYKARAL